MELRPRQACQSRHSMDSSSSSKPITSSERRLENKVAIVTGGASGIGAGAVHLFWQNGAKVIIADIQDELGEAICNNLDDKVSYIHCDVSNEDDVSNLIDATILKYGKLDIMYNNAGIIEGKIGSILTAKKSDLDRLIGVNLVGGFLGAKHAARVMVPARKGCILFTSSACASVAGLGSHAYTASKCAIVGLMKNLAAELGQYGIRVNCVSPYAVLTSIAKEIGETNAVKATAMMQAIGNLQGVEIKVEDVARAAMYLASDEAGYVSGLDLVVDGGFSVVNPSFMNMMNQRTK